MAIEQDQLQLQRIKQFKEEMTRFMMTYKFGLDEMNTKLMILQEEFQHFHDYNPIEHIKSRIKTPESIIQKMYRKNLNMSLDSVKHHIHDIVGFRVVCSFVSDIYRLSEMIQKQKDVTLVTCKDYIKNPKPNGYQSLHLIVSVPVFMSDREENVFVEIQIRTVAMDFWASLEHKIFYKYNKSVPDHLLQELQETAAIVNQLDHRMEELHKEINEIKQLQHVEDSPILEINNEKIHLPMNILKTFMDQEDLS